MEFFPAARALCPFKAALCAVYGGRRIPDFFDIFFSQETAIPLCAGLAGNRIVKCGGMGVLPQRTSTNHIWDLAG